MLVFFTSHLIRASWNRSQIITNQINPVLPTSIPSKDDWDNRLHASPIQCRSMWSWEIQIVSIRRAADLDPDLNCVLLLKGTLTQRDIYCILTRNAVSALLLLVHTCVGVLFCFVLFCFVLFCFVLFCFILFWFVLFFSNSVASTQLRPEIQCRPRTRDLDGQYV